MLNDGIRIARRDTNLGGGWLRGTGRRLLLRPRPQPHANVHAVMLTHPGATDQRLRSPSKCCFVRCLVFSYYLRDIKDAEQHENFRPRDGTRCENTGYQQWISKQTERTAKTIYTRF